MAIDVVLPNYNRMSLLRRAVDSVLEQEHIGIIYIVDDGSDSETIEYYEKLLQLSASIVLIRDSHSGDPGKLRYLGIQNSKAEWIAFLDSDDYWEPGRMTQIWESLHDSKLNLYCSNAKIVYENSSTPEGLYLSERPSKRFRLQDLLVENFVITSTAIARRSALLKVGGFPFGKDVKNCEDFAAWLRLSTLQGCLFDSSANVVYTHSKSSYSRNLQEDLDIKAFSDLSRWVWQSKIPRIRQLEIYCHVFRVRVIRYIRGMKT